jgi:lipoate-protein ligase B
VNLNLHPFELINPCGVERMPVTSMGKMLDRDIPTEKVRETIRDVMGHVFGLEFRTITPAEALDMLKDLNPSAPSLSLS